jgi:hypothetical protein
MNLINLRIHLSDGTTLDVLTSASDIVKWEDHFNLGIDKLEKVTHLLYLAWCSAKRLQKTAAEFEVWIDTVANVEVADPKD